MAAPAHPTVPQTAFIESPFPALGFVKACTTVFGQFDTSGVKCYGVLIQSSSTNDTGTGAAVTGVMYVQIGGVNVYELLTGDEVFVPCSNTNQIKLGTLTGTAYARIIVYQANSK
jgi:hypothetical protein